MQIAGGSGQSPSQTGIVEPLVSCCSRTMNSSVRERLVRWEEGAGSIEVEDDLAAEEPLEIRVEGKSLAVVMRTPGHDRELAAGFLLSEGMLQSAAEIFDIATCGVDADGPAGLADVFLRQPESVDFAKLSRHVFSSSSCGICGKATIESVRQGFAPVRAEFSVSPELICSLPDRLAAAQATFQRTGGLHATALFDLDGKLLLVREDVGRHNALDKVIGHALLAGWLPLDRHLLLVSGRTSFEIVQKALAAGAGFVAAISAPSSLSVAFARDTGQTLVGFLRGRKMNIYAGRQRITG